MIDRLTDDDSQAPYGRCESCGRVLQDGDFDCLCYDCWESGKTEDDWDEDDWQDDDSFDIGWDEDIVEDFAPLPPIDWNAAENGATKRKSKSRKFGSPEELHGDGCD